MAPVASHYERRLETRGLIVAMARLGQGSVRTPSGVEWRIGRRWLSRPLPRWRSLPAGKATAEAFSMPDAGGPDEFATGLVILLGVVVVAVVLIPLLLFGIELIIVGLVVAAGILGRGLLGRPWVVQATPLDNPARSLAWTVVGWRRSGRLIDEVAASLSSGLDPAPGEPADLIRTPVTRAASGPDG
jgi:hypothetical protein